MIRQASGSSDGEATLDGFRQRGSVALPKSQLGHHEPLIGEHRVVRTEQRRELLLAVDEVRSRFDESAASHLSGREDRHDPFEMFGTSKLRTDRDALRDAFLGQRMLADLFSASR